MFFTLVEMLLVIAIFTILLVISFKGLVESVRRTKNLRAAIELKQIQQIINLYHEDYRSYPPDLAAVEVRNMKDPWSTLYQYQNYSLISNGARRKDRNLNPLNSAYDLWSNGKDQKTNKQINGFYARDDIIVANDGEFVGLASDY
ncbi:MAG: hypothetical protein A2017_12160 [Lentisphaerae bacterium GWF2_44_16]|nr:MAG: hypothetical protein A2017_12160 [Lentisphaerae bacterium GWF2_44_16]